MRKTIGLWVAALLLGAICVPAVAAARQPGPLIRVGIHSGQAGVELSSPDGFLLVDIKTGKEVARFRANEKAALTLAAAGIAINGAKPAGREIAAVPAAARFIKVNGRQYRGAITVHPARGQAGLTVVNTLPLEEYVYGILPREISPVWPAEAVKAQAVAARTYALYSLDKHRHDGYDVCSGTDCQVYGGYDSEHPLSNRAVDQTRGLVITHDRKVIPAFFHGSGGGYTENSENVWGTAYPFLRGVPDYDGQSPHYRWQKEYSANEISIALQGAGYRIGELKAIELSPLAGAPVDGSPDRGVSGRVRNVKFIGEKGVAQVSGNKLRTLLGLNSTLFDLDVAAAKPQLPGFPIPGLKNKPPAAGHTAPPAGFKPATRRVAGPDAAIVIRGFGWGHGLGMSQWGAKAMAEKAPAGSAEYFKAILKHYYTGVDIEKIY